MSLGKVKQTLEIEHKPALKVSFKVRKIASKTKHCIISSSCMTRHTYKGDKVTVSSDHCGFNSGNNLQLSTNCWYPFYCLGQCLKNITTAQTKRLDMKDYD